MFRTALFLAILYAFSPTNALSDETSDWLTTEGAIEMATKFAGCAGALDALSEIAKVHDQKATAKTMHEIHNGARLSAMWFLAREHSDRTGTDKPIGEFAEHIDGIISSRKTYVLALWEAGDTEGIDEQAKQCVALNELQTEIVKIIRTSSILTEE